MPTELLKDSIRLIQDEIELASPDLSFSEILLQYNLMNRDHFIPWIPSTKEEYFTLEAQREILNSQITLQKQERLIKFYIFYKNDQKRIIGDLSFSNIIYGSFMACHMGYKIDEKECRKGIATRSISKALDYIFETMNLHRIEANVMPGNKASIGVLEKCGFRSEGLAEKYLQINGNWEDHIRYYLINPNS